MDLNNNYRALILSGLRKSDTTKAKLAETLGYGKAWTTKLLNGTLKAISDADAEKIQKLLGIRFVQFVDVETKVSSLAAAMDSAMEKNEKLAVVMSALLEMAESCNSPMIPRYIETQDMSKIGQEIIRLAFANEDKPGKVTREVLKLLSE